MADWCKVASYSSRRNRCWRPRRSSGGCCRSSWSLLAGEARGRSTSARDRAARCPRDSGLGISSRWSGRWWSGGTWSWTGHRGSRLVQEELHFHHLPPLEIEVSGGRRLQPMLLHVGRFVVVYEHHVLGRILVLKAEIVS